MLTKKFFALLLLVTCAAPIFAMDDKASTDPKGKKEEKAPAKSSDELLVDSSVETIKNIEANLRVLGEAQARLANLAKYEIAEDTKEEDKKSYNEALEKARTAVKVAQKELAQFFHCELVHVDSVVKAADENTVAFWLTFVPRKLNAMYATLGSQYPKATGALTAVLALGATYAIFHEPINEALGGNNDETVEVRF